MVNNMQRKLQGTCTVSGRASERARETKSKSRLHICQSGLQQRATRNVPHATASNTHRISSPAAGCIRARNKPASSQRALNVFIKCNQEMHVIRIPSNTHTYTQTHTHMKLH